MKKAFEIDPEIYAEFKAVAKNDGMKVSKLVERLMRDYIEMSRDYPNGSRVTA